MGGVGDQIREQLTNLAAQWVGFLVVVQQRAKFAGGVLAAVLADAGVGLQKTRILSV
jgi:hypothetical protein